MLGGLLSPHLDFILFVNALGLLFLAAFSFNIFRAQRRLDWLWFGLFGAALSVSTALELMSRASLEGMLLHNVSISVHALGLFFLSLFGWERLSPRRMREAGYFVTGGLLVLPAACAAFFGADGFLLATRLGLAPVAGLLAMAGALRRQPAQALPGRTVRPLLALYIVEIGPLPAAYALARTTWLGLGSLAEPLPLDWLAVVWAVTVCTAVVAYAHTLAFGQEAKADQRKHGFHSYVIGITAVGFAMFVGFTVTDSMGEAANRTIREELFMRVAAVGNAIDPDLVRQLRGSPQDADKPYYRQLLLQLNKIRLGNPDIRFVYVTGLRPEDRQVIITLDTEPPTSKDYAPPGEVYSEAPAELKNIFNTGKAALVGPYQDRWGYWISGFAPVRDAHGAIHGVVGMDIAAKVLGSLVSSNRLVGIAITFLLAVIGAGLGLLVQRNRDLTLANQALAQEIEQHLSTQHMLTESEEKYRNVVERANDGIAVLLDGKVIYVNPRLAEMLDAPQQKLVGRQLESLLQPNQRQAALEMYRGLSRGHGGPGNLETELQAADGRAVPVEVNAGLTPYEMQPAVLFIVRDITERKRAEEELRRSEQRFRLLSITDELTSLYNSRHFFQQLANEIARVQRYGHAVSLVLMDIDDFKEVNDTHGHQDGDLLLTEMGRIIKSAIRETDSAYRYGGEEFALILPDTTTAEALILAERVRAAMANHWFTLSQGVRVRRTISLGVTQAASSEDAASMVRRADQLMYQAKEHGKNLVCADTGDEAATGA